jgi:hypothetical protein
MVFLNLCLFAYVDNAGVYMLINVPQNDWRVEKVLIIMELKL